MTLSEKIYLEIVKWGIFLILILVPLLYIPILLYPAVFSQTVFFRIITEIIFVFYVILLFTNKKYSPLFNILTLGITFFIAILFLTSLFGVNFSRSFWGTITRQEGLFTILHLFLFFLISTSIFKEEKDWLKFFKISVLISLGVSIITIIFTIIFHLNNLLDLPSLVEAIIGNTAFLGFYLMLSVFLSLFLFFKEKQNKSKYFYILIILLNFIALFISGARTAIASLFLGFFLVFIFYLFSLEKLSKEKKLFIVLTILFLVLVTIIFFAFTKDTLKNSSLAKNNFFFNKILNVSLKSPSLLNRLLIWKTAYKAWQDKKIFGWGSENFSIIHYRYFDPELMHHDIGTFDRPHNKFLEILSLNGIVGFISYIILFLIIFYSIYRLIKEKKLKIIEGGTLFAFFVAYIFQNFFLFDTIHSYLLFFLMTGFIATKHKKEIFFLKKYNLKNKHSSPAPGVIILIIVLILNSFLLYSFNFKKFIVYYYAGISNSVENYFKEIPSPLPSSEVLKKYSELTFNSYKKAISFANYTEIKNLRLWLSDYILNSSGEKNPEYIKYSIKELSKNIENKPDLYDYDTYLMLGNNYLLLGQKNKKNLELSEEFLKKAIEISPKEPRAYIVLFKIKYLKGDLKEAENLYKKTINLNPDLPNIYWDFGKIYFIFEEKDKALLNLEKALYLDKEQAKRKNEDYTPKMKNVELLLLLYSEKKDYQKLVYLCKTTINDLEKIIPYSHDPLIKGYYINLYFKLANIYLIKGEKEEAKKTALEILKLNPKILEIAPNIQKEVKDFIVKNNL